MGKFIFEVLLVAVSFTFLLSWGYVKQQRKAETLLDNLYRKCESKIVKALKTEDALTRREIEEVITGTTGKLYWSRNQVKVTDPKLVSERILQSMVDKKIIVEVLGKGPKKYELGK